MNFSVDCHHPNSATIETNNDFIAIRTKFYSSWAHKRSYFFFENVFETEEKESENLVSELQNDITVVARYLTN